MRLVPGPAARAVCQIVLHARVAIATVLPQDAQFRHVVQLVGEVLRGRGVSVDVPVVGWVAEGVDMQVLLHHSLEVSFSFVGDFFQGEAEEKAAL